MVRTNFLETRVSTVYTMGVELLTVMSGAQDIGEIKKDGDGKRLEL